MRPRIYGEIAGGYGTRCVVRGGAKADNSDNSVGPRPAGCYTSCHTEFRRSLTKRETGQPLIF